MKKSKRQKQVELLEKLLDRLSRSDDASVVENSEWARNKITEVSGGDINLDSGGLSKEDMMEANRIWIRHGMYISAFMKQ